MNNKYSWRTINLFNLLLQRLHTTSLWHRHPSYLGPQLPHPSPPSPPFNPVPSWSLKISKSTAMFFMATLSTSKDGVPWNPPHPYKQHVHMLTTFPTTPNEPTQTLIWHRRCTHTHTPSYKSKSVICPPDQCIRGRPITIHKFPLPYSIFKIFHLP